MLKKIKFYTLLVLLIFFAFSLFARCRASAEVYSDSDLFPIPTYCPDREVGYSHYLELLSPSPAPEGIRGYEEDLPSEDPSSSPTPDPFIVSFSPAPVGAGTFSYSSVRTNNYVSRIVNGVRRYYRGLTGNLDSVPPTQGGTYIKRDEFGIYTPTNLFSQNCRLYSSDDYLFQGLYFDGISGIPVGSSLKISGIWTAFDVKLLLPTIDILYAYDLQVNMHVTLRYSNDVYDFYDFVCTVSDMQQGVAFDISVVDDVAAISIELTMYNTLPFEDNGSQPALYFTSANENNYYSLNAAVFLPAPSQETNAINEQTNIIGGFFSAAVRFLIDSLSSLIVPNPQQLQAFIERHQSDIDSTPFSAAWVVTTRLLSIFANPSDQIPDIIIPAYSLTINGHSYQLFSASRFDLTQLPANLLTYSRMIGDTLLAWAFFKYLAAKFAMFFNVKFADTILEIDSDDEGPSMFK